MTYRTGLPCYLSFSLPLWIPVFVAIAASITAARLEGRSARRSQLGACLKCNYSRAGLAPSVVCPECGVAAQTPPAPG